MTILHTQKKYLAPLIAILQWDRCYIDKLTKELKISETSVRAVIQYARQVGYDIKTRRTPHSTYYVLVSSPPFTDESEVKTGADEARMKAWQEGTAV